MGCKVSGGRNPLNLPLWINSYIVGCKDDRGGKDPLWDDELIVT